MPGLLARKCTWIEGSSAVLYYTVLSECWDNPRVWLTYFSLHSICVQWLLGPEAVVKGSVTTTTIVAKLFRQIKMKNTTKKDFRFFFCLFLCWSNSTLSSFIHSHVFWNQYDFAYSSKLHLQADRFHTTRVNGEICILGKVHLLSKIVRVLC